MQQLDLAPLPSVVSPEHPGLSAVGFVDETVVLAFLAGAHGHDFHATDHMFPLKFHEMDYAGCLPSSPSAPFNSRA